MSALIDGRHFRWLPAPPTDLQRVGKALAWAGYVAWVLTARESWR